LPWWAILAGSVPIVVHLAALVVHAAAAPSGPWPGMEGADMAPPPAFLQGADQSMALPYLARIKMTHNYHFPSNRTGLPEAFLEVRLLDAKGEALQTVHFPDPQAPPRVRQRQALAARWLIEDRPLERSSWGERIPAPNQKVPEVPVWAPVPEQERKLQLAWVPEHEVPKDRPVFRPSDWSLVVVRSVARHLCKVHGAASAEVVRHSREAIPPRILFERELPPQMEELQSAFGRLPR
jgi:hypothetical protein